MSSFFFFIVLILTFVFGHNVLAFIGYPQADFTTSTLYRLFPLTYLATGILGYYIIIGRIKISDLIYRMKPEFLLLATCFIVIGYLKYTNNLDAFSFLLNTLYLPAIISILIKSTDKEMFYRARNLVYGIFFITACIAVIEKLSGTALLGVAYSSGSHFRPSALFGHPLNNALIIATLTIILFYGTKDKRMRIIVLITGMVSVFCFGARGGMIGIFLGILVNTVCNIIGIGDREARYLKMKRGLLSIIGFGIIFFVVLNFTHLGSRIARLSFTGSSAEVRVEVFDVLHGLRLQDLLWGHSIEKIQYFQYLSDTPIIENFWIIWILKFGLVVTLLLVSAIGYFLFKNMNGVDRDVKYAVLATFICVASTNNSLATSTLVISILIASIYIIFHTKESLEIAPLYSNCLPSKS